jgi:hypothetical protein
VSGRVAGGAGLLLSAGLILLSGLVVERRGLFGALRSEIQSLTVPAAALRAGAGPIARLMEYKSRTGIELQGVDGGMAPEVMPSTVVVPPATLAAGWPVLSIVVDPDDLYDPVTGIVANPMKRGMKWERPAYVSFFEGGHLIFATGAGLRVHGGKSRKNAEPSYRLYFRRLYGQERFAPGALFGGARDPIRSIVVHNDVRKHARDGEERREYWWFVNPLAYDVAARIGCLIAETLTVRLLVNGEDLGPYVLTEHLDENDVAARLGHRDFVLADTKPDRGLTEVKFGDPAVYDEFITWATGTGPLSLGQAAERVDIENLSRWFLSIVYLGPTDQNQGLQVLDRSRPGNTWFWVNWDMDHSFVDRYHRADQPWEFDAFASTLTDKYDLRAPILTRLLQDSPEYRDYFSRLFVEVMNHRVTREFVESRIAYYESLAVSHGIQDRAYVAKEREFARHRHEVLRDQMRVYVGVGPSHPCRVTSSDPAVALEIDGYPYPAGAPYEGWYFEGMTVTIRVPDDADRGRFSHWRVNGEVVAAGDPELTVAIERDATIEAVF